MVCTLLPHLTIQDMVLYIFTGMSMRILLLLLYLLWSLVELHSQTEYPYVDFMGDTPLPNHTYIDLNQVGEGSSGVRCRTDFSQCCGPSQGIYHGDWIPPDNEESLPLSSANIYQRQGAQRVILRRKNNASMPSGIYRCDIPTNAVHDDNDISVRQSVYVGLYATGGNHDTITKDCCPILKLCV